MVLVATTSFAGKADSLLSGVRMASGVQTQMLCIPYAVDTYGFNTGINIQIDSLTPISMVVGFYDGPKYYAIRKFQISTKGWTGLASDLLPPGAVFRSPTMLVFAAAGANAKFFVTEFLLSPNGFSHITVESK